MCYDIQNIIETLRHLDGLIPGSTSKGLGGGASVLILTLALLRLLTAPTPSNAVPRDCVPCAAMAPGCMQLHRVPRSRRGIHLKVYVSRKQLIKAQHAYILQRADIACILPVALTYVASSLCGATPENQRMPDSASL